MVTVLVPDTPVTTPDVPTVAMAVLVLSQVPPADELNVTVALTQTFGVPLNAEGFGLSVTICETAQPVDIV
jgi:hypothetical protein